MSTAAKKTKEQLMQNHPNVKGRVLPHSLEAESAVLGSAMIGEDAQIHILNDLSPDDFYSPSHKIIFDAMQSVTRQNKPVDIVTLVTELESLGQTEAAGGLSYVTALSNAVPSAANYKHYSNIVKHRATLRKLISASGKIADVAFTGDSEGGALQYAEKEIFDIAERAGRSDLELVSKSATTVIEKLEYMFKNPGAGKGIPTGFKRLDNMLNGFQPSDLIVIAARPGQGKTSIGMNFLQTAVLDGNRRTEAGKPNPYSCAVFSLEMSAAQLAKRLLCSVARVNLKKVNDASFTASDPDWKKIYNAKAKLDKTNLYIDDGALTPQEIVSKCRRLKREKGLDMIMIDYLQLMETPQKLDSRLREITEITRMLKLAAKDLNIPILLLSQMNRESEKRKGEDKAPQMSDLRESGSIEQDADIILFIQRKHDSFDTSVDDETRNTVHLVVAKHRNGETGRVEMRWRGEYTTFEDVDKSSIPPPPSGESSGTFTTSDSFTGKSVSDIMKVLLVEESDDDPF